MWKPHIFGECRCVVKMDNIFTSFWLAEELRRKMTLFHTLRKNKPEVLPQLLQTRHVLHTKEEEECLASQLQTQGASNGVGTEGEA